MNRTQAIKNFLLARAQPDLAELYNHNMEVQVMVGKDNGERVDGDYKGRQWHGYTDGVQIWKSFRIPWNKNTAPEYTDGPMTFDLEAHAEGIGMTGWDWVNRLTRWVAFDFDSLIGHSSGVSQETLEQVEKAVQEIEWVTLRRSSGGSGLHIYVFVEPFPTQNYVEHAGLARAILHLMSKIANFDFKSSVDTVGSNMWVWHRKALQSSGEGFKLLKLGSSLQSTQIPANWKEHLRVTKGHKTRTIPEFIESQESCDPGITDVFDELTSQRLRVRLDDDHNRVMSWLQDRYPGAYWWDADNWLMVTHTYLLQECHEQLNLRGVFKTLSSGREKGDDRNCFGYPMKNGSWVIRRFGRGTKEHETWDQDGEGWTRTFFNRHADFAVACRLYKGTEDPAGGFWFDNGGEAAKVIELLGACIELPPGFGARKCKLKLNKDGRLVYEMVKAEVDPALPGWCGERRKWTKLIPVNNVADPDGDSIEVLSCDDEVRHLITEAGDDYGWVIQSESTWHYEPFHHVKSYLKSIGYNNKEVDIILGGSIARHWTVVNEPFCDEMLPNRRWNRGAAQLRVNPSLETDELHYETWMKLLAHCGSGLDQAICNSEWAKNHSILTGADYLKCWIASLFQKPHLPLPYLFFYGPQNNGKSSFHEAISLLMIHGVARADTALISHSNFNGELEHAILCVVEETDLRKNNTAYNRIKDWVTSVQLPIHKKQKQPYMIPNMTHWVQTSNNHLYCPIFIGDTRITMSKVPPLVNPIPREHFRAQLMKEAPDFLAEILHLELPPAIDRLNIPIMVTEEKIAAAEENQSMLEMFCKEKCHNVNGKMIQFAQFMERFQEWLDPQYIKDWSRIRVGREQPFLKGRLPQTGHIFLGNVDWQPGEPSTPYFLRNGQLYQ